MSEAKGYVYILTNPSFRDDWVKIGFAKDVDKRVKELSGATGVPLPFEIFATMKTEKYMDVEQTLHHMIDGITELRINKNREFFNITPETAYGLFRDLAKVIDDVELKLYGQSEEDLAKSEKEIREKINRVSEYSVGTTFELLDIPVNAELVFREDNTVKATVVDRKNKVRVVGDDKSMTITAATKSLKDKMNSWSEGRTTHAINGFDFWLYKGEVLFQIRKRIIREMELQKREEEQA